MVFDGNFGKGSLLKCLDEISTVISFKGLCTDCGAPNAKSCACKTARFCGLACQLAMLPIQTEYYKKMRMGRTQAKDEAEGGAAQELEGIDEPVAQLELDGSEVDIARQMARLEVDESEVDIAWQLAQLEADGSEVDIAGQMVEEGPDEPMAKSSKPVLDVDWVTPPARAPPPPGLPAPCLPAGPPCSAPPTPEPRA